ncbi:DUF1192 domain-containing protein [Methylobacterium durans]|uniref:DUF1192 domain-containing protein n=1 Tax=Methylobacterium durans TaxID=2202825 RepID=A0A2U8WB43_9HYPH|nr:DUF1192 domain-containing protein [Methylobacterium durans]AWN43259.1 DUF1192 domain-containing protein [Methylobacterium durans]MEA1833410.1 DUF1192 domain-containing protein [Methylobacterium durans]
MDDEMLPLRRSAGHEIGQKLDDLSVEEIGERIALLRREIERLEAARAAKQAAKSAAGSVFKF